MGCASSSSTDNPKMEQAARRRLSVGHVDASGGEDATEGTQEENRGLITALDSKSVLEMVDNVTDRKFSLGSETDTGKTSFANKSMREAGDKVDTKNLGMGFTCRKGLKPESPNQDSWMIMKVDGNFAIYGVFDGHGKQGHDVSNFVKENLPKLIIKDQRFKTPDMPQMLKDSFKKMQSLVATADRMKKLSAQLSGTTCTVCVHDFEANKLTIAHVADSTCCLSSIKADGKFTGIPLTRDHKPDLPDERARIEKNGGRVIFDGYSNHRVYAKNGRYPGLNMSRCLGDLLGHSDAGCTCEPEVSERKVAPEDHILLLCSDGVWEFMSPQEAAEIVAPYKKPEQAMSGADTLAKEAWDRWIQEEGGAVVDDITAVLIYLQHVGKGQNSGNGKESNEQNELS
jgi:serine/threonine protein phosphatase PrpC